MHADLLVVIDSATLKPHDCRKRGNQDWYFQGDPCDVLRISVRVVRFDVGIAARGSREKTVLVLMGFGVKVDHKTNLSLDLDKTYRIIRAAVEAAGLECIRADDIVHAGMIDKPMYQNLLRADVAIADLSTSNENAIYELRVRHALKPRTTIARKSSSSSPLIWNWLQATLLEALMGLGDSRFEQERNHLFDVAPEI
jgi:hypothetical protein